MSISTLGRKAMKKQLKKLKAEANKNLKEFHKVRDEIRQAEKPNGAAGIVYAHMSSRQSSLMIASAQAINSLIEYVSALKAYTTELEETFNKLLEPKKQAKPAEKKEETKKTSYIK